MERSHRIRAFTVHELLIGMSVVAIGLAMVVPPFLTFMQHARLTEQASALVASLNFSRSEAIRRNQTVHVCALNVKSNLDVQGCLSTKLTGSQRYSWGEGVLAYADKQSKNTPAAYSSGEEVRRFLFLQQLDISLPAKQIAFTAEGRLSGGGAHYFLIRDGKTQSCRTVRLTSSGKARQCGKGESNCDMC